MQTIHSSLTISVAALMSLWFAGCNSAANHSEKTPKGEAHDHAHHHHGPHNGHLMELGEEEYHAEWTHDESGKVTFYVLDSAAEKGIPIIADEITIDVKIGDHAPKTYKLQAVDPK